MVVALIIFTTVTVGIAKIGDMKEVGRIGLKSLIYFEVLSTIALLLGWLFVTVFQPGAGMNINPASIPVAGLAMILGVDRFMGAMRTVTNVIGNSVATLAPALWAMLETPRGVLAAAAISAAHGPHSARPSPSRPAGRAEPLRAGGAGGGP